MCKGGRRGRERGRERGRGREEGGGRRERVEPVYRPYFITCFGFVWRLGSIFNIQ